jgi:hypothetical protein
MNEPRRLIEGADGDLERALLGAGRECAPRAARDRAVAAACAVVTSTALASGSAAAGGAIAKAGVRGGIKWIVLVAMVGVGAGVVEMVRDRPAATATATATTPTPTPTLALAPATATATAPTPAPATATATALAPTPTPTPTLALAPTPEPAPSSSSLPEELTMLEHARSALSSGNPARALSVLDAYTERFPHPALLPEATVLRIEALTKAGDPSAARRAADAFLAANPASPYADRIRTLLGASNH